LARPSIFETISSEMADHNLPSKRGTSQISREISKNSQKIWNESNITRIPGFKRKADENIAGTERIGFL
jgi:hypothetical protein